MKKLYEFSALLEFSVIVATDNEKAAREEIENYERAWIDTGDFIGVNDVDLIDSNDPDSQDKDVLNDLAHVIV